MKELLNTLFPVTPNSIRYKLNTEEVKSIIRAGVYVFVSAGLFALAEWFKTATLPIDAIWIPLLNVVLYTLAKYIQGKEVK